MSRIRGRDTKPELLVRSMLHRRGYRYRLHSQDLPGRPDLVLPRYKTVVFAHGCFWHRHSQCKFAYSPKSRLEFWEEKFQQNVERDRKNVEKLKQLDWKVAIVWECGLRDQEHIAALMTKLDRFIQEEDKGLIVLP